MAEPRPPNHGALRKKFHDFDKQEVYNRVQQEAHNLNAKNFVVLFGPDHAKIALDLETDDFKDLLSLTDKDCPVRWINFWNTTQQKDAIKIIGNRYNFSRRLLASITYWDELREDIKHLERLEAKKRLKEQMKADKKLNQTVTEKTDLEAGLNGETSRHVEVQTQPIGSPPVGPPGPPATAQVVKPSNRETLENFKVLQDSLNYTTTDHGPDFFCFGANWLHKRPMDGNAGEAKLAELVPPHHWAWYALCADEKSTNTVVSIHEAPNYSRTRKGVKNAESKTEELKNMRTNTVAVLEQLSNIGIAAYSNNLFQLKAIREPQKIDPSERTATMPDPARATDTAASNLFYYLFEDYSAVAPVLNNSGRMLTNLSDRVLGSKKRGDKTDTSTVIQELHELGKGLRQLHHLFESYKNLFETIQKSPALGPGETRRVQLESQARNRFNRLIDRLQLLMLNTIREYIAEKTELSSTYFNLTAQKDSEATARLTRSATLLAKLSVFFLPISFITSYFSVQITELNHYTAKTYWYTFAVVATMSFLSLFFFSKLLMFLSDRLDDIADIVSRRVGKTFGRGKDHEKED